MDLTLYEKSLGASSIPEGMTKGSMMHINEIFNKSPMFKKVLLNGVDTDSILNHTKETNEMGILFRPQTLATRGNYVEFNSDILMITEFIPNELYPKGKLELCNSSLKWKDELNVLREYKCIVKGNTYEHEDSGKQILLTSNSELLVAVPYSENTKKIKPKQRFVFSDNAFEVVSIDSISQVYKDNGIITFTINFVSTTATDDIVNQVADESGNSSWGSGSW